MLSSWRSDSELGGVNASPPGSPVALSPELAALLAEAAAWRDATSGAFDPAVGALIDAWDLRGAGRVPVAASLAAARAAATFPACLELSAGTATRLLESCWVDSGGFGKGAALRAARAALGSHGVTAAVLDFGGQVEVLGPSVPIAVAHPAQRDLPYRTLLAGDVSLATSSQSERFVEAAGVRYGHVLDPRTGSPVPAWGSVTVLAGDPLIADVLSTALFVMGPDSALAWARARTDVGVLVLQLSAGDVIAAWNPALEPFLQSRTTTTNTSKETF
jgi:thiamine biosynthesis lipoprotein